MVRNKEKTMCKTNIIDMFEYKKVTSYTKLDKLALLKEMVKYQEDRFKTGKLMKQRGLGIFRALLPLAETPEFIALVTDYLDYLEKM